MMYCYCKALIVFPYSSHGLSHHRQEFHEVSLGSFSYKLPYSMIINHRFLYTERSTSPIKDTLGLLPIKIMQALILGGFFLRIAYAAAASIYTGV